MFTELHNAPSNEQEEARTPERVWNDLDPFVRERAVRILSDLCYAYITTTADSTLDNNDSEFELISKSEAAS